MNINLPASNDDPKINFIAYVKKNDEIGLRSIENLLESQRKNEDIKANQLNQIVVYNYFYLNFILKL